MTDASLSIFQYLSVSADSGADYTAFLNIHIGINHAGAAHCLTLENRKLIPALTDRNKLIFDQITGQGFPPPSPT